MDKPNQRSSHSIVVPRCGGIPLVLLFILSILFFIGFKNIEVIGFLLGGLFIALIGLFDDIVNLKGKYKILGMVLASLIPILFGLKLNYLGLIMNNQFVLGVLSLIWIYGMINAFNFMDGIDGLIGGVSVIFSFFMLLLAVISGNSLAIMISLVLMAVCAGFLLLNFNPASIFLGDIGSMFLGYSFALLSIMIVNQSNNYISIYPFFLILAPIIYDSMVTFIRRGFEGKNVIKAHREHLYQRLIINGYSHRRVSIIYYVLSLFFGLAAVFYIKITLLPKIVLVLFCLFILVGFSGLVRVLEKNKNA
ncbi:MAG: undecaprenyl/decaprenyl-phosphate alpha-N-acetylglucosaminyl 1-phosphate transferase [Candidatus Saganbacteria bacterium]|nr:undecaprenyl/decaprenyl-phosphate alpha-N-acetylglucosaminyl 1-phosphate transferase [Candidatus Saganbacteria bacterium]